MDACQIKQIVECACGEVAHEIVLDFLQGFAEDGAHKTELIRLQKAGCSDLEGALADCLFNDLDFLQDMIGDRIYGEPNRTEILKELEQDGNYRKVVQRLRR